MKKKTLAVIFAVILVILSSGCSRVNMPFNGDIQFHSITLTVPQRFIRDSTQSNNDLWVFEHGNYSEYMLISRKDITGDISASLSAYADYMKENGAESSIISFLGSDAVASSYYLENVFCQELLIPYDGSFYAIALRGGTESGFQEITDSIHLSGISTDLVSCAVHLSVQHRRWHCNEKPLAVPASDSLRSRRITYALVFPCIF